MAAPFPFKKDLHYFAAKVIFALTNHLEWTLVTSCL